MIFKEREFKQYMLIDRSVSIKTYNQYLKIIGKFFDYLNTCNVNIINSTSDDIRSFLFNLKDNKILNNEEIEESSMLFKVSNYTFIMSILTCISNLFNELIYNLKRRG